MSVVYACEDAAEGSTKMDQITLDVSKAASRLRCAFRAIGGCDDDRVADVACVVEEVAACLVQIETECSDMARLCHFYLPPEVRKAVNDAIDKYLETVEGGWPDRYFCTQAFFNHSVRKELRGKTAIADAVSAFRVLDKQEHEQRRQLVPVMPANRSSGKKKPSGK